MRRRVVVLDVGVPERTIGMLATTLDKMSPGDTLIGVEAQPEARQGMTRTAAPTRGRAREVMLGTIARAEPARTPSTTS